MKLLFDQNLAPQITQKLADIFLNSIHIRNVGMRDATDTEIWNCTGQNDYTIMSKDADFQQLALRTSAEIYLAARGKLSGENS